ncbi:MAG: TetR family transcriptional regulator C-terminal domain-containing protein [Actinobacteria bacterium]|nr:TetR family transcriptional regulator C-terminal domain-containing protein [Actinomycetota bacterium]
MPIQVDVDLRLDELAVATLKVVQRDGLNALTIRAVAQEVGRSTTVVTNYLPSRAALVLNAFRHGRRDWDRKLDRAVAGLTGRDRLRRTLEWWSSTEPLDGALRQLWLEILLTANENAEFAELIARISAEDRSRVAAVLGDAEVEVDDLVVDTLLLLLRGFWLSATEDPREWYPERGLHAFGAVADALLAQSSD